MSVLKNIKTGREIEKIRALGFTGRFRRRGPRRNHWREYQDCAADLATHGTLYHTPSFGHKDGHNTAYALTGWLGDKPIIRQLQSTCDKSVHYLYRRS